MGIIDNAVAGALGYAISEMSKSHSLRDVIDQRINRSKQKVTLEDLKRRRTLIELHRKSPINSY